MGYPNMKTRRTSFQAFLDTDRFDLIAVVLIFISFAGKFMMEIIIRKDCKKNK